MSFAIVLNSSVWKAAWMLLLISLLTIELVSIISVLLWSTLLSSILLFSEINSFVSIIIWGDSLESFKEYKQLDKIVWLSSGKEFIYWDKLIISTLLLVKTTERTLCIIKL